MKAAGWLSDAGGGEPQVEYISRRRSEEYADFLVEQHRSQGERMMKFQEFEPWTGRKPAKLEPTGTLSFVPGTRESRQ